MSLSSSEKRVIIENPHLDSRKLALILNVGVSKVKNYRAKNIKTEWRYSGSGLPFIFFNVSSAKFSVEYKGKRLYTGVLSTAIKVLDHLIWCIENGLFDMPRIGNPYFSDIKFGERK